MLLSKKAAVNYTPPGAVDVKGLGPVLPGRNNRHYSVDEFRG